MNLFEMEKHHTKTLWLLALLLTFSTVVWAQGTPEQGVCLMKKANCSLE